MSRLTVFLARFIGLFTVLLVVALLVRGSASIAAAVADGQVMWNQKRLVKKLKCMSRKI
jgi:hypothetical protein